MCLHLRKICSIIFLCPLFEDWWIFSSLRSDFAKTEAKKLVSVLAFFMLFIRKSSASSSSYRTFSHFVASVPTGAFIVTFYIPLQVNLGFRFPNSVPIYPGYVFLHTPSVFLPRWLDAVFIFHTIPFCVWAQSGVPQFSVDLLPCLLGFLCIATGHSCARRSINQILKTSLEYQCRFESCKDEWKIFLPRRVSWEKLSNFSVSYLQTFNELNFCTSPWIKKSYNKLIWPVPITWTDKFSCLLSMIQ